MAFPGVGILLEFALGMERFEQVYLTRSDDTKLRRYGSRVRVATSQLG